MPCPFWNAPSSISCCTSPSDFSSWIRSSSQISSPGVWIELAKSVGQGLPSCPKWMRSPKFPRSSLSKNFPVHLCIRWKGRCWCCTRQQLQQRTCWPWQQSRQRNKANGPLQTTQLESSGGASSPTIAERWRLHASSFHSRRKSFWV